MVRAAFLISALAALALTASAAPANEVSGNLVGLGLSKILNGLQITKVVHKNNIGNNIKAKVLKRDAMRKVVIERTKGRHLKDPSTNTA